MEMIKWVYFQFRKQYGYPIFIRFKQEDLNAKFQHLLTESGFSELSDGESKKIALNRPMLKILTVQGASPRVQLQIQGSDLIDRYGAESISIQSNTPIYTYRRVGVMAMPNGKSLWDLAIKPDISQTDQMVGMRIVLVRFLAQALAEQGGLCYWGTVKDDTVVMMKQAQSFGEAIVIDLNKRMIFFNGGEIRFDGNLKILRKDKDVKTSGNMNREEIISFLSVSTCLLSFSGITQAMKRNIYELSLSSTASYAITESVANL